MSTVCVLWLLTASHRPSALEREPVGQVEPRVGDDNAPRELTVGEAVAGHGVAPVVADQKLVVAPAERARRDRSGRAGCRANTSSGSTSPLAAGRTAMRPARFATTSVSSSRKSTPCGSWSAADDSSVEARSGRRRAPAPISTLGQADASARVAGEREPPPARGEAHVLRAPHRGERVANVARRFEAGLHARERRRHGPQI